MTATNPILSGFYPDPSICAVGKDFYLVNSTFAYFPGVPIFHSTDLAHWEQIGSVLNRPSQLPLKGCRHSQGIYAPTIRYHAGVFYMITTNVSGGGNFIVTATDPAGPWSEPYFLGSAAPGIDPSLFFDTDGKCYYVGTRPNPEGVRYNGDWEIWTQELELGAMRLRGESHALWKGALRNAIWPEGPHLYKKDGCYYLMIAEGGTGPDHSVSVARSGSVFGPYTGNPKNPILTHRHLGKQYPVVYVGHGDLVEDPAGNWYMVMLASRPCEGYTNLGRETFLAKVTWEDGWPVVNAGVGKLERRVELPLDSMHVLPHAPLYSFYDEKLDPSFLMLRNPEPDSYTLDTRNGVLSLRLRPETLKEQASPAYICVRQQNQNYQAGTLLQFEPETEAECAGLAVVQSNTHNIRFEKYKGLKGNMLRVVVCKEGVDRVAASCQIPEGPVMLRVVSRGQQADFVYEIGSQSGTVAANVDMRVLSVEVAGGFTGCTIGMYASSNKTESNMTVQYAWFFYSAL